MMASIAIALTLAVMFLALRWIAAVPLMRTLTCAIDTWADSVHGSDAEPLLP